MAHPLNIKNGLRLGFVPANASVNDNILLYSTTGDITKLTALPTTRLTPLTANTAVITDASGYLISDPLVSATEISYLNNVTSNIQVQLDSKQAITAVTANRAIASNGSGTLIASTTTDTELGYLSGTTSSVQTQLNSKQATITGAATTITSLDLTASRAVVSNGSGKIAVSATTGIELGYLSGVTSAVQTQLTGKLSATITSPTIGDILYYSGSAWINLPIGSSGNVLAVSAGIPTWSVPTVTGLPVGGTTGQYLRKSSGTNYDAAWDTFTLSDVTDVTSSAAEVNILDGATINTLELNYLLGTTSNLQTQLDLKLSTSLAYNALFVGNVSNTASQLSPGANNQVLMIVSGAPTWQTFTPGTGSVTSVDVSGGTTGLSFTGGPVTTTGTITAGGSLVAVNGGTGQTSYTVGDLLYASTTTALSKRGIGTSGQVLTVSAGLPVWSTLVPVTDGDKGDITVSSSGSIWTIDNDVVTFAKMQNVSTQTLLGRYTAATGDIQQVTLGSGLTLDSGTGILDTVVTSSTLFKKQYFTADGSTSVFTVTSGTIDQLCIVFVGGQEYIEFVNYTRSGNDIDFGVNIPNGVVISVTYFEELLIGGGGGGLLNLTNGNGTTVGGDTTSIDLGGTQTADILISNTSGHVFQVTSDDGAGNIVDFKVDPGVESYLIHTDINNFSGQVNTANTAALFSEDLTNTYGRIEITSSTNGENKGSIIATNEGSTEVSRIWATPTDVSLVSGALGTSFIKLTKTDLEISVAGNNGSSGQVLTSDGTHATWQTPSGGSLAIGTTLISSGTTTRVLYDNAGILGEYTISGTGNVAMTTSPVFTTPNIGSATGSISGNAGTATAFQTGRTIGITGDLVYTSPSFDGSSNVTAAGTLATVNSNVGSFGSSTQVAGFTVNAKGLITAASNTTITPAVGSITGLGTGIATWLATPSSANLATAITDETGSGALVFASSPTLVNPIVGTQAANDNSTKGASTAYVDAKVVDAIVNGVTTIAPSQNAVANALTLKQDRDSFRKDLTGSLLYLFNNTI